MSLRTAATDPTILTTACLKELANLGREADEWMLGALERDSERSMDEHLRSPETLQRIRNTWATLNRALKMVEAVGKKYQREVYQLEMDQRRFVEGPEHNY